MWTEHLLLAGPFTVASLGAFEGVFFGMATLLYRMVGDSTAPTSDDPIRGDEW